MSESPSSVSVLCIDDEPGMADLIGVYLEQFDSGITVTAMTGPEDALNIFDPEDYDCIVSDFDMPRTDGLTLLATIRAKYPDFPFILFTGRGSEEIASDAISTGVTDYMQKEQGTDQYKVLATRVRNAVSSHRFRVQAISAKKRAETILEAIPNAVFVSIDDCIVDANPAAFDLLTPQSEADIFGTSISSLFHPIDQDDAVFEAVQKGDADLEYERFNLDTPQGGVPIEGSARPITWGDSTAVVYVLQDISDRIGHEKLLEQKTELLGHTERIADVGSWEIDTDTMKVFRSDNLSKILGIDNEHQPFLDEALDVYHEEDRSIVEGAVENALHTGEPFDIEVRFERPEGEVRWLRVHGTPTVTNDEVVTLRGAVQDITEHRRIEAELRQERDLLEGFVETSPIGITVVDADGTLTFVNERAEEIYGRSRETISEFTHNDPRWDLIDEDGESFDDGTAPFDQVASGKESIHDRTLGFLHPSGDRVWVSVNGVSQWDDDGDLLRAIFTFEDITEQRELETRLAEILGRVTDAFYALDGDFRFTHVNERAEELLQASAEMLLGENLWEQYPEAADIGDVWDAFHIAMETQDPQSYELYYEPLNFRVEATVYPSETGVSVYFRDVTDQRAYEREIERQNERLEEYARVISHDLRSPLNVVQGRLALAYDEFESDHLDAATSAVDRMERIIADMLWQLREGRVIGSTVPVDVTDAVEDAWAMIEGQSQHGTLVVSPLSGLEAIEADEDRLCQLLENLFRNAIEHGGDAVTVHVGGLDNGFYIEDDGPGIPNKDREAVFEVGYSTTSDGTGFGLSIVKQFANAHGWTISIAEGTDGGARFEITGVERSAA